MRLSKYKMYFALHAAFISAVLLYQSLWFFGNTTDGIIVRFDKMDNTGLTDFKEIETMDIRYNVNYETYEKTYTRNATPELQTIIKVRYWPMFPGISRPDSFVSNWFPFIISYIIFFLFTTMIFFIPNDTMPKGTYFIFSSKMPWLKMSVNADL